MFGIWEGILKQRESNCNLRGGFCHGGVVDKAGGSISSSLQQLKGKGLICYFQPFWSLTVRFINQIPFEAGLEGLAFPVSWAWDALGRLPPHYLDQQLQMEIAGDGQTLRALCGLLSGCSNPAGFESWELNSLRMFGNAWDRQMSVHPYAAPSGSLPAREEPGLEERMDPAMDKHWTYALSSVLAFKTNGIISCAFHVMSSVFWYMTNIGNNKERRKNNQLWAVVSFFFPLLEILEDGCTIFSKNSRTSEVVVSVQKLIKLWNYHMLNYQL